MASLYILQTYLVYLIVMAVLFFTARETARTKHFRYLAIGLVFYAIIFGIRYGVGTDCIQYIKMYDDFARGFEVHQRVEIGYKTLMSIFISMSLPCWCFMAFVAFAQLFLIFRALKDKIELAPFIALTFMLGCTWLVYSNGMRQTIAFCLFVLSLYYGEKRNWVVHYGLLVLAILFHKSAMLLLVFYPLLLMNKKSVPSIKLQYILFIIAFIIGRINIIQDIFVVFEMWSEFFGYDSYVDNFNSGEWNMELTFGVGYYINILLPLLVFKYSYIFRNSGRFTLIYNMFFVGSLLKYAFLTTHVIQRVNYYFFGFDFIVGAIVMYYLYKNKKLTPLCILCGIYILLFVGQLYKMFMNASAYFTIFQIDDYMRLHVKI